MKTEAEVRAELKRLAAIPIKNETQKDWITSQMFALVWVLGGLI